MIAPQYRSLESITLGNPIIALHDKVIPIYDPVKRESTERLVLNTGRQRNVLVFYPSDFSSVCPTELDKLNDLYPQFLEENAEVLIISRDSILVHEKWVELDPKLKGFKIKMVSDKDGVLGKDIGLIHPKTGEYERVSMIIAPTGQIGYIGILPAKIGRNMDELLKKVQALNYILHNPEKMCPEGRAPGDEGITPIIEKKQFTHE